MSSQVSVLCRKCSKTSAKSQVLFLSMQIPVAWWVNLKERFAQSLNIHDQNDMALPRQLSSSNLYHNKSWPKSLTILTVYNEWQFNVLRQACPSDLMEVRWRWWPSRPRFLRGYTWDCSKTFLMYNDESMLSSIIRVRQYHIYPHRSYQ